MDESPVPKANPRPPARHFFALIVIGGATALSVGLLLRAPVLAGANDISRWCTVWSLLEQGTYVIDECPWQSDTVDKVKRPDPFQPPPPEGREPAERTYSSKPPLLSTLIAGLLYPLRKATGVPLGRIVEQKRNERSIENPPEDVAAGKPQFETKTEEPVEWPANVLYFNPVLILLNVVPYWAFLVLFARLLDRYAPGDWAWMLALTAAAVGNQLLAFNSTLNNHTVAAYSAFFALYPFLRIWEDGSRHPLLFTAAGFFGAFCACNELPAALFGLALFGLVLYRAPKPTLLYFVPAAAIPCLAFLITQYLAFGQFRPVYEEFGTKSYTYHGSYWTTPLEFDWYNDHPEPKWVYLLHMTLGHHGVLSLTPIFLFSAYAAYLHLTGRARGMTALAWLTTGLTVAMLAFYAWNPKARNYGGSTSGLRWLFWLYPFWLALLPTGLGPGEHRPWFRRLSLAALMVSVFTTGYALSSPWSHPWTVDLLEHLNVFTLQR